MDGGANKLTTNPNRALIPSVATTSEYMTLTAVAAQIPGVRNFVNGVESGTVNLTTGATVPLSALVVDPSHTLSAITMSLTGAETADIKFVPTFTYVINDVTTASLYTFNLAGAYTFRTYARNANGTGVGAPLAVNVTGQSVFPKFTYNNVTIVGTARDSSTNALLIDVNSRDGDVNVTINFSWLRPAAFNDVVSVVGFTGLVSGETSYSYTGTLPAGTRTIGFYRSIFSSDTATVTITKNSGSGNLNNVSARCLITSATKLTMNATGMANTSWYNIRNCSTPANLYTSAKTAAVSQYIETYLPTSDSIGLIELIDQGDAFSAPVLYPSGNSLFQINAKTDINGYCNFTYSGAGGVTYTVTIIRGGAFATFYNVGCGSAFSNPSRGEAFLTTTPCSGAGSGDYTYGGSSGGGDLAPQRSLN